MNAGQNKKATLREVIRYKEINMKYDLYSSKKKTTEELRDINTFKKRDSNFFCAQLVIAFIKCGGY